MDNTKFTGEIRDPIHGYILFSDLERELIDSRPFQRLRRIKQLAGAYLVYPGAEHSRFSHSLGVMHLAGVLAKRLSDLGYIDDDLIVKLRIAGLLHDIGHGPFSHVFEELLVKYLGRKHEDMSKWIVCKTEISDILRNYGYDPLEIAELAVGELNTPRDKAFLNQAIAGHFSVDTMDFLIRDSHFTGVEYGKVDIWRLINSLLIEDGQLAMDITAFYALEAFLIARYEMFKAVYFHRSVRSAEVMIIRAMDYANEKLHFTEIKSPEDYLRLDDSRVMYSLLSLKHERDAKLKLAYKLAEGVYNRSLYKCAFETITHSFASNLTLSDEKSRNNLVKEISRLSGVSEDYIIVDLPTVHSLPYSPTERELGIVPVVEKHGDRVIVKDLRELSPIIRSLGKYVNVIRVYTDSKFRDKVREFSESLLTKFLT